MEGGVSRVPDVEGSGVQTLRCRTQAGCQPAVSSCHIGEALRSKRVSAQRGPRETSNAVAPGTKDGGWVRARRRPRERMPGGYSGNL